MDTLAQNLSEVMKSYMNFMKWKLKWKIFFCNSFKEQAEEDGFLLKYSKFLHSFSSPYILPISLKFL
jgi:hypothetical protein